MTEDEFDDFFSPEDAMLDTSDLESPKIKAPPRLGILENLTTEEFDVVARSAHLKQVEPGTVIFRQGDESDRFFILIDGQVQIERDGERIATLEAGAFFGEGGLLTGTPRSATVIATQASSVWSIDFHAFDGIVSRELLSDASTRQEVDERIRNTP